VECLVEHLAVADLEMFDGKDAAIAGSNAPLDEVRLPFSQDLLSRQVLVAIPRKSQCTDDFEYVVEAV
jgi:hypothetical protein